MERVEIKGVRIAGICACVPRNAVANEAKVAEATGIVTRRIAAEGTTVVDLCVKAAERVISDTGARPEEFGALLFVSFTQPNRMPCAACEAQARLGFPKDIIAFDVSLACSGWGYGLYLAGLLARETGRKVLLLDGDVQSAFTGNDETTAPLLADGGTATVVEKCSECSECSNVRMSWQFEFVADGVKGDALRSSHGETIKMDGFGVFRFVATDVVSYIKEFLSNLQHSNIQTFEHSSIAFVPHQPNAYMVRQLAKSVGIEESRTAISCDELGNLSSASVPATIALRNVRGPALIVGFGGGLSVSLGQIDVDSDCKLAFVEA